jgi:small subunit ribosomal protein S17
MTGRRKSMVGRVVSNKMDKTVVVVIERLSRHRLYGKVIKLRKRMKAHDADNACKIGDVVRIVEGRPLSKEKTWVVQEIVRSGAERVEE